MLYSASLNKFQFFQTRTRFSTRRFFFFFFWLLQIPVCNKFHTRIIELPLRPFSNRSKREAARRGTLFGLIDRRSPAGCEPRTVEFRLIEIRCIKIVLPVENDPVL